MNKITIQIGLLSAITEEYRKLRPSATETLIVSGDLDPSTPAEVSINWQYRAWPKQKI
jgi:hypothetical protein